MSTVFNFSAGPAMLPHDVMQQAQAEFLNWHDLGVSVMEISHRSAYFMSIAEQSEKTLRSLLNIPNTYHVLFMPAGAQLQFSGIPLNILGGNSQADYFLTGLWSQLAYEEACKYGDMQVVCHGERDGYRTIPASNQWRLNKQAAYGYYCDNETVHGLEFDKVPEVDVPLICDMSSNFLTRPIDIEKFGLIFACTQKNFGPAGLTVVIVRDDLLARSAHPFTPKIMDYRLQLARDSMLNTPPTFKWYMAGLVFDWVASQGGVQMMDQRARERSNLLYAYIDSTDFYDCPISVVNRSRINVVFDLKNTSLQAAFLSQAEASGLRFLKGHKKRGGLRASLYNAMPIEGAQALLAFMKSFEKDNQG